MALVFEIIVMVMYLFGAFVHFIGLVLLLQVPVQNPFIESQHLYLIYLSIAEGAYCFTSTILYTSYAWKIKKLKIIMFITAACLFYTWFIFIIILLTIDRVLNVRFNIQYVVIWTKKKSHIAAMSCFCVSVCVALVFFIYVQRFSQLFKLSSLYYYPFVGFLFVAFICFSYAYLIYLVVKQRRTPLHGLRPHG